MSVAGPSRWVKSPEIIERMRHAGTVAAEVLRLAGEMVQPGITTDSIDRYVHQLTIDRNAYPSPLNYNHYPKSVCTSVNEVICHGIPDSRMLQDGDIVNIDVTATSGRPPRHQRNDPRRRRRPRESQPGEGTGSMWHGIEAVVPGKAAE